MNRIRCIHLLVVAVFLSASACGIFAISGDDIRVNMEVTANGLGNGTVWLFGAPSDGQWVAGFPGSSCHLQGASSSGDCRWSWRGSRDGTRRNMEILARPDPGYRFVGWTGCQTLLADPTLCEFSWASDRNYTVAAQFEPIPPPGIAAVRVLPNAAGLVLQGTPAFVDLTAEVDLEPGASGTPQVAWTVANPAVLSLSTTTGTTTRATAIGQGGSVVTATATLQTPAGPVSKPGTSSIVVTLAPPPPPPTQKVTIRVVGTGDGTGVITASGLPGGALNCSFPSPNVCETQVDQPSAATGFTIAAVPTAPSAFISWTGCLSQPVAPTCTLSIGGAGSGNARVVTVRFNRPGINVRINASVTGTGVGSVSGAGISCGSGASQVCAVNFTAPDGPGTRTFLALALPVPPSVFHSWGGDCVVSGNSCQLQWDSDVDVTMQVIARFDPVPVGPPPPQIPLLAVGDVIVFDVEPAAAGQVGADLFLQTSLGFTRLTTTPGPRQEPVWSPDGTRIAFRSKRDDSEGEIHVINVDGNNEVRLTTNANNSDPDLDFDHDPVWSHDGTKILFVSYRTGDDEIWQLNANGTGVPINLTNRAGDQYSPAMSPDGTKILFVDQDDENGLIMVMDANGNNQRPLTGNPTGGEPAWSPDGTRIAFVRNSQVWLMNADGTNQQQLTSGNNDDEPAWSPDGTKLVFSRGQGVQKRIWGLRLSDPSTVLQVTTAAGSSEHPSWKR